jgi:hypothetical protein
VYPRVASYAAICGANPVASMGQRAFAAGTRRGNEGLDDPVSPFMPAQGMPTDGTDVEPVPAAEPAEQPLKDQGDVIDSME